MRKSVETPLPLLSNLADDSRSARSDDPTRAERGKYETNPARRAHAASSAASESIGLKRPFQPSGFGSLFYFSREYSAGSSTSRESSAQNCFAPARTERGHGNDTVRGSSERRGTLHSLDEKGLSQNVCAGDINPNFGHMMGNVNTVRFHDTHDMCRNEHITTRRLPLHFLPFSSLPFTAVRRPFLALPCLSLPFAVLSLPFTAFRCPVTALPWPFPAFPCLPLSFACPSLPFSALSCPAPPFPAFRCPFPAFCCPFPAFPCLSPSFSPPITAFPQVVKFLGTSTDPPLSRPGAWAYPVQTAHKSFFDVDRLWGLYCPKGCKSAMSLPDMRHGAESRPSD